MKFHIYFIFSFFLLACNSSSSKNEPVINKVDSSQAVRIKPASSYSDTLIIDKTSAVFYYPDSIQLEKIKEVTEKGIFESTMHEFFYQIRNAKIVIQKNYPDIKIIEARNVRILCFTKNGSGSIYIDLNTKNDAEGLFLFDTQKTPQLVDMMNIDTELWRYFGNTGKVKKLNGT